MCSERYAADIPLRLPKTQLPPTRSDFSKTSNGTPASWSFFAAAMPDEPAPMMQALGSEVDTGVKFNTGIFEAMEPTRTAVGTWSGGRFMKFGEPLDDDRLVALLRPDDRVRTVLTADVYGEGDADGLL